MANDYMQAVLKYRRRHLDVVKQRSILFVGVWLSPAVSIGMHSRSETMGDCCSVANVSCVEIPSETSLANDYMQAVCLRGKSPNGKVSIISLKCQGEK